jgi:hypothetical protein
MSQSESFSSGIDTDDEEEYLNNIIDEIDNCENIKRTPSDNKFDLRLWRKLWFEEEQKLKLSRMNSTNVELNLRHLSPILKTKLTQKPWTSSRNVTKYNTIEFTGDVRNSKNKIVNELSFYSYNAIEKKSVTPAPAKFAPVTSTFVENFKNSTKHEQSYNEAGFELGILGKAVHSPFGALKAWFLDKV